MTTPADELRQAAATIREVAEKATPGPWQQEYDGGYIVHGNDFTVAEATYTAADAKHIALWSPDVAELVAGLLDHAAGVIAHYEPQHYLTAEPWMPLARLINGGAK